LFIGERQKASARRADLLEFGVMKAALLVESLTGNTWKAAEKIGSNLEQEGWSITGMSRVGRPDHASIQAADIVLVGTWTHGLFVVGQAPWAANAISNLPAMQGKKAAVFLTYALDAGKSLDKLTHSVGATGAEVIGGLLIKRNHLDMHTEAFADRLVGAIEVAAGG
jgi:flavodoxin